MVRPAWRRHLVVRLRLNSAEVKSTMNPTGGIVSHNGKGVHREVESEGSRRQSAGPTNRIVYKAAALDERANRLKVQYLYGKRGSRHGGHKREGVGALPGEISRLVQLIGTTIVERRREEP